MRAANPNAVLNHVFEEDKGLPPEQQTTFPISQLTAEERAFLLNVKNSTGTVTLYALHLGLGAPKNFTDDKGNPIAFQRDEKAPVIVGNKRPWKAECLNYLPARVMDDLAALVLTGIDEGVNGSEAKNS